MKTVPIILVIVVTLFFCGCGPKLTMTVETRDAQGSVIERADVTNADTSGRTFRADGKGTINLTALAEDSDGLQALRFEGGFSCNTSSGTIGQVQQGTYSVNDPNLSQHPTSETFANQIGVQCSGGTYSATIHACATDTKNGSTCTKDATLHAP